MEIETIFSDSKWKILSELSHGPLSPTELANKTKTTIANISTQIRLLEALDFIEEKKLDNVEKGQPRKLYSMKKCFAYLILGTKQITAKKMLNLNNSSMPFFNIWMISDPLVPPIILRFYLENESALKDADSFGYLGLKRDDLDFLVIHNNPDSLRNLIGKEYTREGKTYRVNMHLHTMETFNAGITNKEEYFTSLLRRVFVITDSREAVTSLKIGKRRQD